MSRFNFITVSKGIVITRFLRHRITSFEKSIHVNWKK